MEYLHRAGEVVGGRHSPRAKPRAERRRPADRVFDSAKPVKQQIEADIVAHGRIRRFETVPHKEQSIPSAGSMQPIGASDCRACRTRRAREPLSSPPLRERRP